MKKSGVLVAITFILFVSSVLAQSNETSGVEKAYQCLQDRFDDSDESSLALSEGIFGILALGSNSKLLNAITDEEKNNCWPSSGCRLKETAQVVLAYDRINKDTSQIEEYLISKNATATGLNWFLLIDIENHAPASCTITYSGASHTISVEEDMKISGNPGSCLRITPEGYWLSIEDNCIDRNFDVSCDGDFGNFITTLLYKKSGSDVMYVSSTTTSTPAGGEKTEHVNARCFRTGSSCDYEGSLWTALALQKTGHDVSAYTPYLIALSEDNKMFFSDALLYILKKGDEQFASIIQSQKNSQYWQAPNTPYNKFYDTSLGMLALQGSSSLELNNAKDYLLAIQDKNTGCWNNNNLRDTAFILYSGWPKNLGFSGTGNENQTGNGTSGGSQLCEPTYSCSSYNQCADAGGSIIDRTCSAFSEYCCSVPVGIQATCTEQGGRICTSSQICEGNPTSSSDGTCCIGQCIPAPTTSDDNECEQAGGTCDNSCLSSEEESSLSCSLSTDLCCVQKDEGSEESGSLLWIVILIILIILIALAIIFRRKLQVWWFKFKRRGGIKSSPTTPRRPPFQPPILRRQVQPQNRPGQPQARSSTPQNRPVSKLDQEMEETLRKLKEMSD
ncbi:hypothetical protein COU60_00270 [Candidatus Pacearchaeota archaeon CG10_big_fil_rev_8_21_14_0_10_34_76]|nr:MAG: hypothetical protein COU60_00270 [Candidatus Pacearchaeota archaeon CG10_big_fil_rev_8_21_14_0_10_34_76]